jgi:hypothetical protein
MPEESAVPVMEMRFDTGQQLHVKSFPSWDNPSNFPKKEKSRK